jgi:hypothetical protein
VQSEADDWIELGGNHKEPLTTPPAHWCQQHQAEYKRHEKNGEVWYSHQLPGGKGWCNERSTTS